jgi:hypothetical protein
VIQVRLYRPALCGISDQVQLRMWLERRGGVKLKSVCMVIDMAECETSTTIRGGVAEVGIQAVSTRKPRIFLSASAGSFAAQAEIQRSAADDRSQGHWARSGKSTSLP